jgi:hypothetical protein
VAVRRRYGGGTVAVRWRYSGVRGRVRSVNRTPHGGGVLTGSYVKYGAPPSVKNGIFKNGIKSAIFGDFVFVRL